MKRINLTSQIGWFNLEAAEQFKESATWNGSNQISDATGSQWEHECLYKTASGKFVLNHWSQYQGSKETYELISKDEAIQWLVRNGRFDEAEKLDAKAVSDLEI